MAPQAAWLPHHAAPHGLGVRQTWSQAPGAQLHSLPESVSCSAQRGCGQCRYRGRVDGQGSAQRPAFDAGPPGRTQRSHATHEAQPRRADADRQCPVLTDNQPDPFSETNMYTPCRLNSDVLIFSHADVSEIDIHLTIHVQIPSKASFPEKRLYGQQWISQSIVSQTGRYKEV